jgi:hypothetical protein
MADHRCPGLVELMRWCGSPSSRNAVGLLDENDVQFRFVCDARHRDEVSRLHAAACTVTEDERASRFVGAVQVRMCGADRRHDLDLHGVMVAWDDVACVRQLVKRRDVMNCRIALRPTRYAVHQ